MGCLGFVGANSLEVDWFQNHLMIGCHYHHVIVGDEVPHLRSSVQGLRCNDDALHFILHLLVWRKRVLLRGGVGGGGVVVVSLLLLLCGWSASVAIRLLPLECVVGSGGGYMAHSMALCVIERWRVSRFIRTELCCC